MLRHCTTFVFGLALSLLGAVGAHAQATDEHRLRLYAGPGFGFGGESELDVSLGGGLGLDGEADLITTFGAQAGAEYLVHRYFAIGGEFRFGAINTEAGDDDDVDRSKLYDLVVKPRVRYPFARLPLELYLTVPIGLTIPRLSDDLTGQPLVDLDEKVGWNLGIGGGITYLLSSRVGINVEPIWLMHWFTVEASTRLTSSDMDFAVRQFRLLVNLVVAL